MRDDYNPTEINLNDVLGALDFLTDMMDNHLEPDDYRDAYVYGQVRAHVDEAYRILAIHIEGDEDEYEGGEEDYE